LSERGRESFGRVCDLRFRLLHFVLRHGRFAREQRAEADADDQTHHGEGRDPDAQAAEQRPLRLIRYAFRKLIHKSFTTFYCCQSEDANRLNADLSSPRVEALITAVSYKRPALLP